MALAAVTAGAFTTLAPQQNINGKFGYVNATGRFVIQPRYDDAHKFWDGLAAVQRDGKWGYINEQGRLVVKCKYGLARDFYRGYGIVRLDGKWGAVNTKGELEIPCEYERVEDLLDLKVFELTPAMIQELKKLED